MGKYKILFAKKLIDQGHHKLLCVKPHPIQIYFAEAFAFPSPAGYR
jgi:hypothetical protein